MSIEKNISRGETEEERIAIAKNCRLCADGGSGGRLRLIYLANTGVNRLDGVRGDGIETSRPSAGRERRSDLLERWLPLERTTHDPPRMEDLSSMNTPEAQVFNFEVFVDAVFGTFAAQPGLLDSAERCYLR